ncbi:hypothetical protein [Streptomyces fractus]|uniref:hypothetical protein n=1 Tax=Streptomyces fractus TaxID=641806 RepID=UPI003CECEA5F
MSEPFVRLDTSNTRGAELPVERVHAALEDLVSRHPEVQTGLHATSVVIAIGRLRGDVTGCRVSLGDRRRSDGESGCGHGKAGST